MLEEWKPVCEYEGLYEVSNLGRVKRVARQFVASNGSASRLNEMIIKEGDRHEVILCKEGKYRNKLVRSLVVQAFLGLPYGTDITHIDRDFGNARLDNLVTTEKYRMMDPNWRDIPGWEGEYQASRFGEIRSLDRYVKLQSGGFKFLPGVVRSLEESNDGYYQVGLYRNGKCVITTNAHIFVAKAWIPNPENKPTVNHIDGNKKNNCIENLEWATYSEQQEHAERNGLRKHSYWNPETCGPVGGDWNEKRQIAVRCIETGVEYPSFSAAGAAIGQSASEIKLSVEDHRNCKGLHFVRASEPDYVFGVESLEGEEWRPIPKFEDRYMLSNKGRIKSVERVVKCARGSRTAPEKLINLKYGIQLTDSDGVIHTFHMNELQQAVFNKSSSHQKQLFKIH